MVISRWRSSPSSPLIADPRLDNLPAMDASSMDSSHGQCIETQVWHQFGSPVVSSSPGSSSFWLHAAFSRSRIKLSAPSVGSILQSILGGPATSFAVVEVEEGIF